MGNEVSKYNENASIDKYDKMALQVDLIANRIILKEVKQNSSLSDSGRCSQLIIITSEILKRLPFKVISFMNRRRKTFGNDYENFAAAEKVLLLDTNSSSVKDSDIDERDTYKKMQMCIGIARFYVQVGNLFNAIMSTIRPFDYMSGASTSNAPYNYCDLLANSLFETDNFDKYVSSNLAQYVKKQRDMNSKLQELKSQPKNELFRLTPSVCSVYDKIKGMNSSSSSSSSSSKKGSLFSTLDRLYLDVFGEKTYSNTKPEFIEMSNKMFKEIYLPDVHALYTKVTGRVATPEIRSFSDIPFEIDSFTQLRDNCNRSKTGDTDAAKTAKNFNNAIIVNDNVRTSEYFDEYLTHIRKMISKTNQQRAELIELLNRVFIMNKKTDIEIRRMQDEYGLKSSKKNEGLDGVYSSDANNSYSRYLQKYNMMHNFYINPQLTDSMLQEIINEARVKIVRMYVSCQENFLQGVSILDKIHKIVGIQYDTSSRFSSGINQGNAIGSDNKSSKTNQSNEERINYIRSEIGISVVGNSFNSLLLKLEKEIARTTDKKQIRIMRERDDLIKDIYKTIERVKQNNGNINDRRVLDTIDISIEESKAKLKAIINKT